jgi:hypothetical protein
VSAAWRNLGLKSRLAGFLAGGPALFHQTREPGADGGTHAAAAAALLRHVGSVRAPAVSGSRIPFEGINGVIQSVALGFEFANDIVSVQGIPFSLDAIGEYTTLSFPFRAPNRGVTASRILPSVERRRSAGSFLDGSVKGKYDEAIPTKQEELFIA